MAKWMSGFVGVLVGMMVVASYAEEAAKPVAAAKPVEAAKPVAACAADCKMACKPATACFACPDCKAAQPTAGKCKCGKDMVALKCLGMKDSECSGCACPADCKCTVKEGETKCSCGKDVIKAKCPVAKPAAAPAAKVETAPAAK